MFCKFLRIFYRRHEMLCERQQLSLRKKKFESSDCLRFKTAMMPRSIGVDVFEHKLRVFAFFGRIIGGNFFPLLRHFMPRFEGFSRETASSFCILLRKLVI